MYSLYSKEIHYVTAVYVVRKYNRRILQNKDKITSKPLQFFYVTRLRMRIAINY